MFTISTAILALYLVAYALLHSLLAGTWAKGRARRAFGSGGMRWYRLIFTIVAAATLLPLIYLFYLFPGEVIYFVPAPWRWGMVAVQAAAAFGLAKTLLEAGPLQFLGIRPDDGGSGQLIVRGIYCRTRTYAVGLPSAENPKQMHHNDALEPVLSIFMAIIMHQSYKSHVNCVTPKDEKPPLPLRPHLPLVHPRHDRPPPGPLHHSLRPLLSRIGPRGEDARRGVRGRLPRLPG